MALSTIPRVQSPLRVPHTVPKRRRFVNEPITVSPWRLLQIDVVAIGNSRFIRMRPSLVGVARMMTGTERRKKEGTRDFEFWLRPRSVATHQKERSGLWDVSTDSVIGPRVNPRQRTCSRSGEMNHPEACYCVRCRNACERMSTGQPLTELIARAYTSDI